MKCHFCNNSTEAGETSKQAEINEAESKETQSNVVESQESIKQSSKTNSEAAVGG